MVNRELGIGDWELGIGQVHCNMLLNYVDTEREAAGYYELRITNYVALASRRTSITHCLISIVYPYSPIIFFRLGALVNLKL
jgi:hypothetical protein